MRTNDLRAVIKGALDSLPSSLGVKEVSYDVAINTELYPHITFGFSGTDLADMNRKDYTVDVDIWTKDEAVAEDIADSVEDMFIYKNAPTDTILPTFYLTSRIPFDDPDPDIRHIVVRMETQLYDDK